MLLKFNSPSDIPPIKRLTAFSLCFFLGNTVLDVIWGMLPKAQEQRGKKSATAFEETVAQSSPSEADHQKKKLRLGCKVCDVNLCNDCWGFISCDLNSFIDRIAPIGIWYAESRVIQVPGTAKV